MLLRDFDYDLPEELIAQYPAPERSQSRMMVVDRETGECSVKNFLDFPLYMRPGDCIVVNDSKVIPARIFGTKVTGGGRVEALLVREIEPGLWQAMLRPGNRLKSGTEVSVTKSSCVRFVVQDREKDGIFNIRFNTTDVSNLLVTVGEIPLPPYVRREANESDRTRYQTVFANNEGSIAAPTAGLHFDCKIVNALKDVGIKIVPITLHINLGTFKPVKVNIVEDHQMHREVYTVSEEAAHCVNSTISSGHKVCAIGTSVVRVLETCASNSGQLQPGSGTTNLFLHPPKKPRIVQQLLTNFHLPKSTLLMLICIFSRREFIIEAYRLAIRNKFRFYSYGDCMLLK